MNTVDKHSDRHTFKGGKYSILVRLTHHGISVYVGLNDIKETLSPNYTLRCLYSVVLKSHGDTKHEGILT